jgi:hypothetical protein
MVLEATMIVFVLTTTHLVLKLNILNRVDNSESSRNGDYVYVSRSPFFGTAGDAKMKPQTIKVGSTVRRS